MLHFLLKLQVINKIDLPTATPFEVAEGIRGAFNMSPDLALMVTRLDFN